MEQKTKRKMQRRSIAERIAFIKSYKASGQSRKEWCEANNVHPKTLEVWLKKHSNELQVSDPVVSFVEIMPMPKKVNQKIHIEIGSSKLELSNEHSFEKLVPVLKAVFELC